MKKLIVFLALSVLLAACGQTSSRQSVQTATPSGSLDELISNFIAKNGGTGYEPYTMTIVDSVYSKTGEMVMCGVEHYYSVTNRVGVRMDTTRAWFAVTPDMSRVMYMTGTAWDYNDWKLRFTR